MSAARSEEGIPPRYGIGTFLVVLVALACAVLVGQSFLRLRTVLAVAALGLLSVVVSLFYRLVVAVERIAYEP
ncbi:MULTISPECIES: hypothetical protein [Saliphagus]|uniref:Uncharacterized protein n=1 Tax=Saliphagus infecundisoli TaxID=1849069 RepID=A0ABD5QFK0_9EURY|nr:MULTISPECIES: hypothetical protein [Saliphagus]